MGEISSVQEPVTQWAERHGWLARRMQYIHRNGCADTWFFRGGHIVIMEFKALGKPLRLQQKRERERLLDAGIYVHVIDRADRGIAVLRAYD